MPEVIDKYVPKKQASISIQKLLAKKFKTVSLDGEWSEGIGEVVELNGVWFLWGQSGNGKTRGSLKLAKYLTKFGPVIYNTLEEGARLTMQKAIKESGIANVARRFVLLDREPLEDLKLRLRNRKAPRVVFIDSFQYLGLNKKQYIQLKQEFPDKLFIFISHAEGKQPEGKVAKFARYDADVKLFAEGYKFFITSRFGGSKPVVISKELSDKYWKIAE